MEHFTPAAPAVRETLERLLASETFRRAERARALLRYLVERELAGDASRLKGFAIAVDVFGKDAGFDASADTIVRVQAGRLRGLLDQYFSGEGIREPIRFVIPRGSYVPVYSLNQAAVSNEMDAADPLQPIIDTDETATFAVQGINSKLSASMAHRSRTFWAFGGLALLVPVLGALIIGQQGFSRPDPVPFAGVETTVATSSIATSSQNELPTVYIDVSATGAKADRIAASLRTGLSGFETINFIGRASTGDHAVAQSKTSFVFHVLPEPNKGGVTLELQNLATGRVLLSRDMDAADAGSSQIEDQIAGILTAAVTATGTIYNYIEQNGLQEGLTQCLILNEKYYLDQIADKHKLAYRCFESLIHQDSKSPLVYAETASLNLEAATKGFPYPASADAEQAMAFARQAIQIGSTSASVHRSFGYLNTRLGNPEAAIRWMRKAYEFNRYDLGMAAAYGYALVFAGNYAEGTPILERAIEAASAHPTWWDYGLFAGKFMLGDRMGAKHASDALITTIPRSHYLVARIVGAAEAGDQAQVKDLGVTLNREFPTFMANPRKVFQERNYPADLTDRLVRALQEAGISDAS